MSLFVMYMTGLGEWFPILLTEDDSALDAL